MWNRLKGRLGYWLGQTPIGYFPVKVRAGMAKGAHWTLLPHSSYWRGHPEAEVEAAILGLGDLQGAVCWDLGTHFGIFTVGLAFVVGPQGQIVGLEPDPSSFARCRHHVKINDLDNVKLYNAAASSEPGTDELLLYEGQGNSTAHLAYPGEMGSGADRLRITKVRMDDLVEAGDIRPPRIIKVDVEGHGGNALRGAASTIDRHRPVIIMSFHSGEESNEANEVLQPLGYKAQVIGTSAETGQISSRDWFGKTLLLRS
jgi:FkbM family methyltransferase